MLDEYWYKGDTPYSYDYKLWSEWLYKNNHNMPLGEAIESAYIMWKL